MKKIQINRFTMLILVGILGVTGVSYSDEIPVGLKVIMEQLETDPTVEFNDAKKFGFIKNDIQMEDFKSSLPVEVFIIDYEVFDTCDINSIELLNVIKKTNRWYIPMRIKGEYAYYVRVKEDNENFHIVGAGTGSGVGYSSDWDKIRKRYPESTGIRPILIQDGNYKYIHFPNEKPNNLLYLRPDSYSDSLSLMASRSLDSLDDVKTIFYYRKKDWEKDRARREQFDREHPGFFKKEVRGEK